MKRQRHYVRYWADVENVGQGLERQRQQEAAAEIDRLKLEAKRRKRDKSKKGKKDGGLKRMTRWLGGRGSDDVSGEADLSKSSRRTGRR